MSLSHNTDKIITDGLSIFLDAANYKSWTANVKNLITNNPTPTSASGYLPGGGTGDILYDPINQAVLWNRKSYDSWGAFTYNSTNFYGNLNTAKQYTASFEWKTDNIKISNADYSFEICDGPDLYNVVGANILVNSTSIGGGWYRFSYTFTPANSGRAAYFRIIIGGDRGSEISNFYWRKLQLEQNSTRTDFVDGSTPSTWNDISGNKISVPNTNLAAYVPDNNGGLWFPGDYTYNGFTIPSTSSFNLETLGASKNFTVMFGLQKKYYGQSGNLFGNSNILNGSQAGYANGWRITESNPGTPGNAFTGTHTFVLGIPDLGNSIQVSDSIANRPAVVAFSVSPTTLYAFCNGNSSTSAMGTYVPGSHYGQVGSAPFGVGSFGGNFYFMMIYNRALSAAEITQNYNALKGRYGL